MAQASRPVEIAESGRDVHPHQASSAVMQVLHTTELLEWILLYLPLADLLVAQRISSQCHNVIAGSLSIRRALFLEPLAKPKPSPAANDTRVWHQGLLQDRKRMPLSPLLINSLNTIYDSFSGLESVKLITRIGRTWCATGSWRDMLVVQPYAEPMEVPPLWPETTNGTLCIERGLRMKDLVALDVEHRNSDGFKLFHDPVPALTLPVGVGWAFDYDVPLYMVCGWDILGARY